MQAWKKSSWPIPQPEMTPRPVTTTRSASDLVVADNAVLLLLLVFNDDGVKASADDKMSKVKVESCSFILGVKYLLKRRKILVYQSL